MGAAKKSEFDYKDGCEFYIPPHRVQHVAAMPYAETIDWGIKIVGVPQFWSHYKGEGIKVAVLDTGMAMAHTDLRDAIDDAEDMTNSRSGPADVQGHGTHCAGTIAARQNSSGVIGAAPNCRLYVGKVLGDNGSGSDQSVSNGVKWAISKEVDVISMSLGSSHPSRMIHNAIKDAVKAGIFVIAAAGNDGPRLDTVGFPGGFPETISVGAVDRNLNVTRFSSRGKTVDIVAPGDQILSCYPPNTFAKLSGTSMATPLVAGVVAMHLSMRKKEGLSRPTVAEMREILLSTAVDIDRAGFDPNAGHGLIDPKVLLDVDKWNGGGQVGPIPPPTEEPGDGDGNGDGKSLTLAYSGDFTNSGQKKIRTFLGGEEFSGVDEHGNTIIIKL